MNEIDKRKLNLLVHLARIDGKFVQSEKKLLHQFIVEKGLSPGDVELETKPLTYNGFTNTESKLELLYWALRLTQADEVIHDRELDFCRKLAEKLDFKKELVSRFVFRPMPPWHEFKAAVLSI